MDLNSINNGGCYVARIELLNKLISQKEEIIKLQDDLILKLQNELKKNKED